MQAQQHDAMHSSATGLADSVQRSALLSVSQHDDCLTAQTMLATIARRWQSLLVQVTHLTLILSGWIMLDPPSHPWFLRAMCLASQHTERIAGGIDGAMCWGYQGRGSAGMSLHCCQSHGKGTSALYSAHVNMVAQR